MKINEFLNKHLFGLAIYIILLPLVVLIFDEPQVLFLAIHIAISIFFALIILSLVIFKHNSNNLVQTLFSVLILAYPMLVFSAYPFSL